ncbi:sarcosine oxidase subunit gamma family protein [Mesorhizobium sp. M0012]|uniref:sarcosine oxidase subunit gamma n=1 Tax=Mesorhizobium sp. M0012 TaxID=2956840 RepID=UPI003334E0BB
MAKQSTSIWRTQSAWAGLADTGRFGASGAPGVTVLTLEGLGFASLIENPNSAALERATKRLLDVDLPREASVVLSDTHGFVWSGPDRWLLLTRNRARFPELLASLSADAAVSDQSHAWAALRLSGRRIREVLAKGSMIDVHPSVFPVGAAALTNFAHIGVQFWRIEDGPDGAAFEILVPRSMTRSFWSWFAASAAEFGYRVTIGTCHS